jgi:uncharacterized protein YndB with AHSA1/START domain
MTNKNDDLGAFNAAGEVRLVRQLPGPIERVWEYLTNPEKRALWLAGGPLDVRIGGALELRFRHRDLTAEETPEEYRDMGDSCDFTGRVTRCEPPRLLSYTWGFPVGSEVTFELTPQGGKVQMVLTHRRLGNDPDTNPGVATGWHSHVALLLARLEGAEPPGFWSTFVRLKPEYAKLFGQQAGMPGGF